MTQSVRKAAHVLDLFSVERPELGPTDVAAELGIAKSSAHALLSELARAGLTERLASGRYRLGWRTVGLARTLLASRGYHDVVAPEARRLARHFGETVHVAAWDRGRVVYVASERPPGGVAAPAPAIDGDLTPLVAALLVDRPAEAPAGIDAGAAEGLRRHGFHVGPQRALEGVGCAVAPLRVADGAAPEAIGLCAPADRLERYADDYGRAVAATSRRIARAVRS